MLVLLGSMVCMGVFSVMRKLLLRMVRVLFSLFSVCNRLVLRWFMLFFWVIGFGCIIVRLVMVGC